MATKRVKVELTEAEAEAAIVALNYLRAHVSGLTPGQLTNVIQATGKIRLAKANTAENRKAAR